MVLKQKEKRRSPRIDLRVPVRYQVRGEPQFDNAITENISIDGIAFIVNKFIPPQTPLMLEVSILSRILKPAGKIVWSHPLAHSDRNRLGIKFLELDPLERSFLEDFIHMQVSKH